MKRQTPKEKLIMEIRNVIEPKLFNFRNKTMTRMEKQILFEALGFLNMVNYSSMDIKDIKKHWDKSSLGFM